MGKVRFIGLDVHADTVAVVESGGEVRSLGMVPNQPESLRKLIKKLGPPASLRVCYEAGPTGYALYWQSTRSRRSAASRWSPRSRLWPKSASSRASPGRRS